MGDIESWMVKTFHFNIVEIRSFEHFTKNQIIKYDKIFSYIV